MAEGLLRARLGPGWEVASAGIGAVGGDPPTSLARAVTLDESGIDIGDQRSSPLTVHSVAGATHVLTMSARQARVAAALAPEARDRIRLLGAFAPQPAADGASADPGGPPATMMEIADPMGGTREEYRACLERLRRAVDRFADWIEAGAPADEAPRPALAPTSSERGGS